MTAPSRTSEAYTPDSLHGGDFPIRTLPGTLITGQNLARGALLGKITVGGKLTLSLAAAEDGSEVPYGILAEAVDATAGDKPAIVYVAGDFVENEITFGAGHTAATVRDGLRALGLHIRKAMEV
ncbi:head decoration protein [Oceanibacterium hippocampi]|uniref:Bacteriophage lambda head decoration protein D n=1 Tax=Oceanibacterium hippocampi TaxID=745714 RepID=A0A1Y5TZN3_9PROT|nr:head decoration protein [Oceanibacterium hippocampi]SLN77585.1 hypothetical protein OCH7691_04469 [Oceanibacterium hippocampi]